MYFGLDFASASLSHVLGWGFASASVVRVQKATSENEKILITTLRISMTQNCLVLEVCFYTPRSGGVTSVLDANHSHELPQLVTPPMNHRNRVRCQKQLV